MSVKPKLAEWDVATGKRLKQTELALMPGQVALSPDGKLLACGEPNDTRFRSNLKSTAETVLIDREGKEVRRFDAGKATAPQSLAFAPDGRRLASISRGGTVRVWEVATGKLLTQMEAGGAEGLYYLVHFSSDRALVSVSTKYDPMGGISSRIVEWDVTTGKATADAAGPQDLYWCLALSPDGKLLARAGRRYAGAPEEVEVWDVDAGKVRHCFKGLRGGPTFLRFAPDGKTLASGSYDDTVLIWDVAEKK